MMPSVVFVATVALQNKFPLSSKFSRNPGSMPRTYTHALSTTDKYMAGFLVKNSGGCCGSTVLTDISCWLSNNCIPAQTIVPVLTELNHNCSELVLDSDNGVSCHHSSSESRSGFSNYGSRAKSDLRRHFTRPQNTFCQ